MKELEKVFPAEYVSHLKAEIATESDLIVREQLLTRVQTTIESILSDTQMHEKLAFAYID